jgi:hypothetical protein
MQYTCRIERVQPTTYDETTLIASTGGRTTIYEGVCRVWEVTGGGPVVVAEADITVQNTQLSIPWDTPVLPQRFDEVLILTAPTDAALIGKRFRIESSAKAGEMRATRRFVVMAMEKTT